MHTPHLIIGVATTASYFSPVERRRISLARSGLLVPLPLGSLNFGRPCALDVRQHRPNLLIVQDTGKGIGDKAIASDEELTLRQATGVRYELNGTQRTQGGDNAR